MLEGMRQDLEGVPEHRTGRNTQYEIADAGLGAFSVFYMQSPSFLAHQRDMERKFTTGHFLPSEASEKPQGWADVRLGNDRADASRVERGSSHNGQCDE